MWTEVSQTCNTIIIRANQCITDRLTNSIKQLLPVAPIYQNTVLGVNVGRMLRIQPWFKRCLCTKWAKLIKLIKTLNFGFRRHTDSMLARVGIMNNWPVNCFSLHKRGHIIRDLSNTTNTHRYLFGEVASVLWVVFNLVMENREVEGKAEPDWVGGLHHVRLLHGLSIRLARLLHYLCNVNCHYKTLYVMCHYQGLVKP